MNRASSVLIGAVFGWTIMVPIVLFFVPLFRLPQYTIILGTVISLLGVWIRYSAMTTMGRYYSRSIGIQAEHELIQTGWYRFVRHPGYLGTILTFIGFGLALESWLSLIFNTVLLLVAYAYRIKVEEAALISHFGDSYASYQKHTWRLIPFLY